jgi:hypothetical protein
MTSVYPKTMEEYKNIQELENTAREKRIDQWPEFSEYTEKFLMHTKTAPTLSRFVLV